MDPQEKVDRLLKGPLDSTVWWLLWPAMLGGLTQTFFVAADVYWVSRLGTDSLAAMGGVLAIDGVHGAITVSMGAAISLIAARKIGANVQDEAARFIGRSLLLGVMVAAAWVALGLTLLDPLAGALALPAQSIPQFKAYMAIRLPAFLIGLLMGNLGAAIRATGDTRTPVVIAITIGVLGAVGTPLLVHGLFLFPPLGIRGAAISGLVSVAVGVLVSVWFVKRDRILAFARGGLLSTAKDLFVIAAPILTGVVCYLLLRAVVIGLAGRMGREVAAGVTAALQFELLGTAPALAAGAILPMFMGYNAGADNPQRSSDGVFAAMRLTWAGQAVLFLGFGLFAASLAGLYSRDPEVQRSFVLFAWTVPFGHIGLTALTTMGRGLVGFGRVQASLALTLGTTLFTVPILIVLSARFGYEGLLAGLVLARTASGALAIVMYQGVLRQLGLRSGLLPRAHQGEATAVQPGS